MNQAELAARTRDHGGSPPPAFTPTPTSPVAARGGRDLDGNSAAPPEVVPRGEPSGLPVGQRIRRHLVRGDLVCVLVAFALPLVLFAQHPPNSEWFGAIEVAAYTLAGGLALRYHGMWSERVSSVRMIELSRVPQVFITMAILAIVIDRKATSTIRGWQLAAVAAAAAIAFVLWRSAYRMVVTAERKRGRMQRRVIVVGSVSRAEELSRLFEVHPELGMEVVAFIGDEQGAELKGLGDVWVGSLEDSQLLLATTPADIVVVCSGGLHDRILAGIVSAERGRQRTLYLDGGMPRVDFRRIHSTAIAHQPLHALEPSSLGVLNRSLKRSFDVLVALAMAAAMVPLGIVIGVAIKLSDRGPVFFKQRRVGLHGEEFEIYKFRTMCVDAEGRRAELMEGNERNGPLFKLADHVDPRITRVGRLLRALSLDELPQLINVLRGEMSLVGPRPALPAEVGQFSAQLLCRHDVRPGITGLWQVEARDNASFEAYERLDLFYVDNWSIALDLMILIGTVDHVVFRPLIGRLYRGRDARVAPAA